MTYCTGLAIFALCLPLPGASRSDLTEAGWYPRVESNQSWFETRQISSGTVALAITIIGEGDTLQAIAISARLGSVSPGELSSEILKKAPKGLLRAPCHNGIVLYSKKYKKREEFQHGFCEAEYSEPLP